MALTKKEIKEIRDALDNAARPIFFFDDDPDGVFSFVQLYRYVGDGKGIIVKTAAELSPMFARKVEEYQPDLVVILDVPVVGQDFFDQISQKIIWLDHHPVIERKGVDYYNPRVHDDKDNRPTSYWAYQIAKKDLWMGMAGSVADWHVPDFKEEFVKQYSDLFDKRVKKPDTAMFDTKIGLLGRMTAYNLKKDARDAMRSVKTLTRIEDPHEILDQTTPRGKYIYKKYKKHDQVYQKLMDQVEVTDDPILLFVYPDNQTSFTSELSNELLHKYPDKFIFVGREKNGVVKLSIRSQKDKVLPKLEKALKAVPGHGGGHDYACGAAVKSEDLKKFISVIRSELEK